MFRTLVNEAYTSEESRDRCSLFVVPINIELNTKNFYKEKRLETTLSSVLLKLSKEQKIYLQKSIMAKILKKQKQ